MSLAFQDLQNLTAFWLDDLNFSYFTPPQVQMWLNNAQVELQKKLLQAKNNYYITPVQTTLVVNQNDYVLPTDFVTMHRLEVILSGSPPFENSSPITPMTINQQDLVPNQNGTPQFYYLKKNRIRLQPSPDTALTLRMHYSYLVSNMVNATDLPDCPPAYSEYIAVLATIDGLLKDGRDLSGIVKAKRDSYEKLLDQEAQDRQEDAARSIVETGANMTQTIGYF